MRLLQAGLAFGAAALLGTAAAAQLPAACPEPQRVPDALVLPPSLPAGEPVDFECQALAYLSALRYRSAAGWGVDKRVRDTGPFIGGISHGTHTAVRVYYSPQVMKWLRAGRQGPIEDGAVIIKEQYGGSAPAEKYAGWGDAQLRPTDWTFMIRKASASKDGWFWGEVWTRPTMNFTPTQYPNAGFGLYCLRCHASAERQSTFSSLDNIEGFPGEPINFHVDDSWRRSALDLRQGAWLPGPLEVPAHADAGHSLNRLAALPGASRGTALAAEDRANEAMLHFTSPTLGQVQHFPPEPLDHQGSTPDGVPQFLTSDNCLSCHSAASAAPAGPSMWIAQGPGIDVSPYGEWRWSPMGLAGRDPVFFAQLDSELAFAATLPDKTMPQRVIDTCMQCHGAMGKRSHATEKPGQPFELGFVFETDPAAPGFRYGGLARDGISCALCHHIADDGKPLNDFLASDINGRFAVNRADELQGPFSDELVAHETMTNALGTNPRYAAAMSSARVCGSCHTIELPVVDGRPGQTSIEQNTYVEWLNSQYQNEYGPPNPNARTCQDCHMKGSLASEALNISVPQIQSRIALIEDQTYPATTGILPTGKIDVRFREQGYRRHELLGLNAFLLEMFGQFSDILGVRTTDYMSGSGNGLAAAIGNVVQQARHETATVAVSARMSGTTLIADVAVNNLAGHKFPSGVGFRRAFLDFELIDTAHGDKVIFASGRTDPNGVIIGADGKPLATEFFADAPGGQRYQPHFDEQHPITSDQQVQIYEELVKDASGRLTTSFIRRDEVVKDNRLLPIGWTAVGPVPGLTPKFLEATHPAGTGTDPNYANGQGTSRVRYRIALPAGTDPTKLRVEVTLCHQSIPPAYLRARFKGADGPATRRLAYLRSRLNLAGTPLEGWVLRIGSARTAVK